MRSQHHALWPWSPMVATLVLLNTAYPLDALKDERRLETPTGDENTRASAISARTKPN